MSGSASSKARRSGITLVLTLLIAISGVALALVYTRHDARQLFHELQVLSRQRDSLNEDWGRLQLEQGAYEQHAEIERRARTTLSLVRPSSSEVFLISDNGDYRFVGLAPVSEEVARLVVPQQRTEVNR
ncbi:MAG: cell division protein FtsL [Pseudomonadota bacterium]